MANTSMADLLKTLQQAVETSEQPKFEDITIKREGKQIIMPEGMSHESAIDWHQRMMAQEIERVAIYEVIQAYPLDGALALMKALKNRYGWTSLVPTPGFWSDEPPAMIGLETGFNETTQVPWGRVKIPGISGYLEVGMQKLEGRLVFVLKGMTQMRHKETYHQIAEDVKTLLKKDSIYRAKAIRVEFQDEDNEEEENFNPTDNMPKFMNVMNTSPNELIFSSSINRIVEATLWTPIEKTALCRTAQIPLKRGILLEGPFGTGKTLLANVTARKAVENGWTFIYLARIEQLAQAMHFGKMYPPAVIFGEDIDRTDDTGRRGYQSDTMNEILNTIDGVGFKDAEIMTVLTTNYVERITQAMLRPGRLDAVISVRAPDAEAVQRLIKLYARNMLSGHEPIGAVAKKLEGQIPATIREVVERSKLAAIGRGDVNHITAADLDTAAEGMVRHLELLREKVDDRRSDIEKAASIVADAVTLKRLQENSLLNGNDH